jgi:hypothetical protein
LPRQFQLVAAPAERLDEAQMGEARKNQRVAEARGPSRKQQPHPEPLQAEGEQRA